MVAAMKWLLYAEDLEMRGVVNIFWISEGGSEINCMFKGIVVTFGMLYYNVSYSLVNRVPEYQLNSELDPPN